MQRSVMLVMQFSRSLKPSQEAANRERSVTKPRQNTT